MGVPYPKTFPAGQPYPAPANDNRPGRVYLPANDNRRRGRSGVPDIRRAARRMPFRDWRLELALKGLDMLIGEPGGEASWLPGRPEGVDFSGWEVLHDFGREPHYNTGTSDYVRAWPNITYGTHFNYPFALAGHPAPNGYTFYVTEFFQNPGYNLADDIISEWHLHGVENYGVDYHRLSSARTWTRTTAEPGTYPEWLPETQPVPGVRVAPKPQPMARVREISKYAYDPMGNPLRGPVPAARPLPRLRPLPRPPSKHTKERKFAITISGIGRLIVNGATETMDAVQSLYDALPASLRARLFREHGGYMSPLDKAEAVYRYINEIDGQKAVQNLIYNEIEDRIIGRLGRTVAAANRRRGSPGGLQLGPALEGVRYKVS